jgi:hypothetical protein
VGEGVLTFRTPDEAAEKIRDVSAHYQRHSRAARGIAEEYFDSDRVLSRLVDEAMSSSAREDAQAATPSGPCLTPASDRPGRPAPTEENFPA